MKQLIVKLTFRKFAVAICLAWLCIVSFTGLGLVKSASAHELGPQLAIHCNGESCNGILPEYTNCLNSAYPIKKGYLGRALLNIMYSPTCNATFVRILSNQGVMYLGATFVRSYPYVSYTESVSGDWLYSQMIGWNGHEVYTYACAGEFVCGYLGYPD
jgi:hypothetical protein